MSDEPCCLTFTPPGETRPHCLRCHDAAPARAPGTGMEPTDEGRIYPCDDCGVMRTKAEGGTTFTVCDACWDKHHGRPAAQGPLPVARLRNDEVLRAILCGFLDGVRYDVTSALDAIEAHLAGQAVPVEVAPPWGRPGSKDHVAIWDAINEYVSTCGGDPSKHVYGNTSRMSAVVKVEDAIKVCARASRTTTKEPSAPSRTGSMRRWSWPPLRFLLWSAPRGLSRTPFAFPSPVSTPR